MNIPAVVSERKGVILTDGGESSLDIDKAATALADAKHHLGGARSAGRAQSAHEIPPGTTYLEFTEGSSAKFWEVRRAPGHMAIVRWGRLGTETPSAQTVTEAVARKRLDEKVAKGYVHTRPSYQTPPRKAASRPKPKVSPRIGT